MMLSNFFETMDVWIARITDTWFALWPDTLQVPANILLCTEKLWRICKSEQNLHEALLDDTAVQALAVSRSKPACSPQNVSSLSTQLRNYEQIEVIPREVRKERKPRGRQPKAPHDPAILSQSENWLLRIAVRAGDKSRHHKFLKDQNKCGTSTYFTELWRNAMGNLSQVSCKHVRLAWKRWEIHTTHCIQFHKGDLEQSLMDPTVSQLAHYLGERSTAGETAASGAYAGLWRMVKALQLDFPLEEPILRGWSARLITRQPTQQIPIEVAEAAHFSTSWSIPTTRTPSSLAQLNGSPWLV